MARGMVIVGKDILCLQLARGEVIVSQGHPGLAAGAGAGNNRAMTPCACSWRGGWF